MNTDKIRIGSTLPNGAILIAINHLAGVVLAMNPGSAQQYVVWNYYRHDLKTTSNGEYFRDVVEAAKLYQLKIKA